MSTRRTPPQQARRPGQYVGQHLRPDAVHVEPAKSSPAFSIEVDVSELPGVPSARPATFELLMPEPAMLVPIPAVDEPFDDDALPMSLQPVSPIAADEDAPRQPEPARAMPPVRPVSGPQAWYDAETTIAQALSSTVRPLPGSPLGTTLAVLTNIERTAFQPALSVDREATAFRRAAGLRLRIAEALSPPVPGLSIPAKALDALLAEVDHVLSTLHGLSSEPTSPVALEAMAEIRNALARAGEDLLAATSVRAEPPPVDLPRRLEKKPRIVVHAQPKTKSGAGSSHWVRRALVGVAATLVTLVGASSFQDDRSPSL